MAVMTINAPSTQHTFHVTVMARTAHMIHNLVTAILDNRSANFTGKGLQHLVPSGALPFAFAALTRAFQGIQDALGVIHLVDGGRAFSTVASTTAGMIGVAFEFSNAACLFIDVCHQSTGSLAVETNGRNDFVVFLYFTRPGFCIIFNPIMPTLRWWARDQITHGHLLTTWRDMLL